MVNLCDGKVTVRGKVRGEFGGGSVELLGFFIISSFSLKTTHIVSV